jgi:hypothetical protein
VRGNLAERKVLANVWFKDGDSVVELGQLWPARGLATGVTVFEMTPDRQALTRILTAQRAQAAPGRWRLLGVQEMHPGDFSVTPMKDLVLPFQQDPATFLLVDSATDPSRLPLWTLSRVIGELDASGSNVERLLTSWHMKWAYAFSVLAMGLIALAMVTLFENVYLNVALSLVVTFAYYAVFMVGVTLGQKGILPPWMGAWLGNLVFYTLAAGRLAWTAWPPPARGDGAVARPGLAAARAALWRPATVRLRACRAFRLGRGVGCGFGELPAASVFSSPSGSRASGPRATSRSTAHRASMPRPVWLEVARGLSLSSSSAHCLRTVSRSRCLVLSALVSTGSTATPLPWM